MYIIAGLGNPGLKYKNTRHNVGWAAVDALAEETGAHFNKKRFDSKIAECRITGQRVALLKPLTYMNLSGRAVRAAAAYYKVPPENIIVIYDDVDLPIGRIRIRGGEAPAPTTACAPWWGRREARKWRASVSASAKTLPIWISPHMSLPS